MRGVKSCHDSIESHVYGCCDEWWSREGEEEVEYVCFDLFRIIVVPGTAIVASRFHCGIVSAMRFGRG